MNTTAAISKLYPAFILIGSLMMMTTPSPANAVIIISPITIIAPTPPNPQPTCGECKNEMSRVSK